MALRPAKLIRKAQGTYYFKGKKIKWLRDRFWCGSLMVICTSHSLTLGLHQCHQDQPLAPAEQEPFVPVSQWERLIRAGRACSVQSRCEANLPWLSQLTLSENQIQQREYDNNVVQAACFSLFLVSHCWHNSEVIAKNGAQILWCVSTRIQIHPMHGQKVSKHTETTLLHTVGSSDTQE